MLLLSRLPHEIHSNKYRIYLGFALTHLHKIEHLSFINNNIYFIFVSIYYRNMCIHFISHSHKTKCIKFKKEMKK